MREIFCMMSDLKVALDALGRQGVIYVIENICVLINDADVIKYEGQLTVSVNVVDETITANGLFLDNENAWISQIKVDLEKYNTELSSSQRKRHGASIIYKITNKVSGKCYVGQSRNYFGFRWYQHFVSNSTTKFGLALAESSITDWMFEILEQVDPKMLNERESFWIKELDCVKTGYNSVR